MSKFEELDKRKTSTVEHELLEKWEKEDLLQQTIDNRKDSEISYSMMVQLLQMVCQVYTICLQNYLKMSSVNIKL